MPPFKRPTAFEASFPDEIPTFELSDSDTTIDGKRKNDRPVSPVRSSKRPRSAGYLRECHYTPKPHEDQESADLVVIGEDMDAMGYSADDKPIRILSSFSFFSSKRDMKMLSLSEMDEIDGSSDWHFEGAGIVTPYQFGEEEDSEDVKTQPQFIRLKSVLKYFVDYSKKDDPIFVETPHAFYILNSASHLYKDFFLPFYTSHRVAQLVVTAAVSRPHQTWIAFLKEFTASKDPLLSQKFIEDDLNDAIPVIRKAVEEQENADNIFTVPFLRHLLRDAVPRITLGRPNKRRPRLIAPITLIKGSLDLAVLRPENHIPPHVTPLIATLASGLFQDSLVVIGPRPSRPNEDTVKKQEQQAFEKLRILVKNAHNQNKIITYKNDQRLKHRSAWLRSIVIDGEVYNIGDTVIMPMGQNGNQKAPPFPERHKIPSTATIQAHFWFARIVHINGEHETAHVQWFWHSSTTAMQEISDPQELFLADLCDTIDLQCVVGKAVVHYHDPVPPAKGGTHNALNIKHGEFFCKFVYDSVLSTYTDIDHQRIETANLDEPPDNCPVCLLAEQKDLESFSRKLPTGVSYHGVNYHVYDFVLIRSRNGPCNVGYITDIRFPNKSYQDVSATIVLKQLGRVSNLVGILPRNIIRDERHLFLTDKEVKVQIEDLIRVCYVFPETAIDNLDFWISLSADHFYIQYKFPLLDVRSWNDRRPIDQKMDVCFECCHEKLEYVKLMKDFLFLGRQQPLQAMDLFGGVGAFGLGMEESGTIKVTHAIEIAPSAAKTFKRNSPDTIVYNACVNTVLRYAIKKHEKQPVDVPVSIFDKTPLPPPPAARGVVDVLLAGFPCQSHSDLNMFRKAEDPKSSLILPTLSWVDFLRPPLCVFENVRGFLRYNVGATQAGRYRVEGGIPMGGLKFVLRALIAMNYQVRYGLLQAAHYGTPQTRVRFFLIAALPGYPLPELPQPYHDFPLADALAIKLPTGDIVRPIRTMSGTAPHPFVNIDDAISDLPRFDWKNPKLHSAKQRDRQNIVALDCKKPAPWCGYEGVVGYHHEPKTSYQVRSRKVNTRDLQHYTRCLIASKVERVLHIPLEPGADYKSLRPNQYEWQFANPSSAVAKAGFRSGLYGRLDKNSWFSTTVTNMDPTAKQSKVLNPYCKRILTVRELARSQGFPDHFVFESINNNVVTMHRQIGNAVPWLVSVALGKEIRESVFKRWLIRQDRGTEDGDS